MRAARMHEYNKPFVLEEVQIPKNISGEGVLVKVGGAGICRTDLQIIDGYFKEYLALKLPAILGHEIAGWVEEIGDSVPKGLFEKGDLVVVSGGWGCGLCPECKSGNDQICGNGRWPGFGEYGGYSEFVPIPSYRYLIKIDKKYNLKPEELAPLTDAGVTTYRAIKKVKNMLGPGKSIAIIGLGGLGRSTFEPGWSWESCVKPLVKTNSCEAPHTGYIVSGRIKVVMDDGTEGEAGPGDIAVIPPGHNAWVVGNEPCVMIDFTGAKDYAKNS